MRKEFDTERIIMNKGELVLTEMILNHLDDIANAVYDEMRDYEASARDCVKFSEKTSDEMEKQMYVDMYDKYLNNAEMYRNIHNMIEMYLTGAYDGMSDISEKINKIKEGL